MDLLTVARRLDVLSEQYYNVAMEKDEYRLADLVNSFSVELYVVADRDSKATLWDLPFSIREELFPYLLDEEVCWLAQGWAVTAQAVAAWLRVDVKYIG